MIAALDGYALRHRRPFFREFVVSCPTDADAVIDAARKHGVLAGIPLSRYFGPSARNLLLVTASERHSDEDFDALCSALARASLVKVG
jgi:glycine dehydrogenase subunit 1